MLLLPDPSRKKTDGPLKIVPVMVTEEPTDPNVGSIPVIVGCDHAEKAAKKKPIYRRGVFIFINLILNQVVRVI